MLYLLIEGQNRHCTSPLLLDLEFYTDSETYLSGNKKRQLLHPQRVQELPFLIFVLGRVCL